MDASGDIGNSEQTGQGGQLTQSELIESLFLFKKHRQWVMALYYYM
jgi:hypothetical protein